ncbi:hypothetical protein Agub_g8782 [Astrephomene gubernaculifera]|uniref:FCP1 homology domain-containing protein n=1 Tax=Astrephomene gubernaculifera TaxID=47775 RepID=A0AAD3DSE4_9CHLO|nr:hypothetical protein Agub_g8782 [Astrephomene gubernaculifera]
MTTVLTADEECLDHLVSIRIQVKPIVEGVALSLTETAGARPSAQTCCKVETCEAYVDGFTIKSADCDDLSSCTTTLEQNKSPGIEPKLVHEPSVGLDGELVVDATGDGEAQPCKGPNTPEQVDTIGDHIGKCEVPDSAPEVSASLGLPALDFDSGQQSSGSAVGDVEEPLGSLALSESSSSACALLQTRQAPDGKEQPASVESMPSADASTASSYSSTTTASSSAVTSVTAAVTSLLRAVLAPIATTKDPPGTAALPSNPAFDSAATAEPATPTTPQRPSLSIPLLPPLADPQRMTLVLDLDGTLIASEDEPHAPVPFDYCVDEERFVWLRPGLRRFLDEVRPLFEVVLFTAAGESWATSALKRIDPDNTIFDSRLYRDHTVSHHDWPWVKDLSRLGRDLARTVIVDDNPLMFMYQPDNALHVAAYDPQITGHSDDVLEQVLDVLMHKVLLADDVREVLREMKDPITASCVAARRAVAKAAASPSLPTSASTPATPASTPAKAASAAANGFIGADGNGETGTAPFGQLLQPTASAAAATATGGNGAGNGNSSASAAAAAAAGTSSGVRLHAMAPNQLANGHQGRSGRRGRRGAKQATPQQPIAGLAVSALPHEQGSHAGVAVTAASAIPTIPVEEARQRQQRSRRRGLSGYSAVDAPGAVSTGATAAGGTSGGQTLLPNGNTAVGGVTWTAPPLASVASRPPAVPSRARGPKRDGAQRQKAAASLLQEPEHQLQLKLKLLQLQRKQEAEEDDGGAAEKDDSGTNESRPSQIRERGQDSSDALQAKRDAVQGRSGLATSPSSEQQLAAAATHPPAQQRMAQGPRRPHACKGPDAGTIGLLPVAAAQDLPYRATTGPTAQQGAAVTPSPARPASAPSPASRNGAEAPCGGVHGAGPSMGATVASAPPAAADAVAGVPSGPSPAPAPGMAAAEGGAAGSSRRRGRGRRRRQKRAGGSSGNEPSGNKQVASDAAPQSTP